MAGPIELVIFDLDGTLVASESLAEKTLADVIVAQLDLQMTEKEIELEYRGRAIDFMLEDIARRYGGELPDTFLPALSKAYEESVSRELRASTNVEAAIRAIAPMAICVASNGEPDTIEYCVKKVGLAEYFDGNYFSARQVAAPKPAPDVFLYAARQMGAAPVASMVIEDTVLGIKAALAAGMRVIGYAGNHLSGADRLRATGVPVITDFAELPALVSL